jgi:hypothetical protein
MNGSLYFLLAIIVFAGMVLAVIKFAPSRRKTVLDTAYFEERWREVLVYLKNEGARQLSIIEADKLLDEALKRRHFSGKTMGERLVSAQREFSNNNSVWAAHKMRNRLVHEHAVKLKNGELEGALKGFRQALKDIGAM